MIARAALVAALLGLFLPAVRPLPVLGAGACTPTRPDMLGPFYTPNAPVRASVGKGFVLTGVVRSARECRFLRGARVEFWLAGPAGQYGDAWRATVVANGEGQYRFESHVPPDYGGRPPHIHVRASAAGHQVLVTQYYPKRGETVVRFDLVLMPE
jgi:protocatechuate 3,4-dioxygenase beta subunit